MYEPFGTAGAVPAVQVAIWVNYKVCTEES